ncbi:dimethylsulfide dehydrogenase [Rhodovulum sulfidophilum]|uniref:ethylbenzene dehydrogenase-related protein n=1 Tax=Rhodovulum sulfidophilum TaxID=35806 RepID=UPI001921D062|nr:ethylbenzene dehydrogenase-related protein [Rhodovulum sulfidophilum]MBL3574958.1 dimethylsulfide dehydrogenase [Rhodovulum sulfidophilum]MCE8432191.1 dimethylsulfide dehydrogenase [Rhodovulum sulfidophilum]MCF4119226.1 dimethylsulfide dehydrogenase [Rhodovulum sulfidophilum]
MPGFRFFLAATAAFLATSPALPLSADSLNAGNIRLIEPGETVPVIKIPDGIYLRTPNDPDDIIWARVPEFRVEMVMAPPVHPSVGLRYRDEYPEQDLVVQLARTSERFYVRLRWVDPTHDTSTLRDRFRDGAAIEFSESDDSVSYMMGTDAESPVNIWYWHPDGDRVESLAAGSPGSLTRLDRQPVTGASEYRAGHGPDDSQWIVVMSRPLASEGDHQVSFERDTIPVAFALWQGADAQRDGLKLVSLNWIFARMTPDAAPAPGN